MSRNSFNNSLAVLSIVALTVSPAILHGRYSDRWGMPSEKRAAAVALESYPVDLGEWVSLEDGSPLDERVQKELGVKGHISRVYQNKRTNRVASVLLMVGDAGPLVRHPPEICYGNRENRLKDESLVSITVGDDQHDSIFRVLSYSPKSPLESPFLVAYAWSSDGQWSVPKSPRIAFGGEPALYKLQVLVSNTDFGGVDPDEELKGLLREFVTAFRDFNSQ
ncbi:hypothetical protein [Aeoliella sp.]|uniref:hypothetical protein n=1 Tax=Aeoliella sp. TaxID=2795800 RepID=UPI003CCBBF41